MPYLLNKIVLLNLILVTLVAGQSHNDVVDRVNGSWVRASEAYENEDYNAARDIYLHIITDCKWLKEKDCQSKASEMVAMMAMDLGKFDDVNKYARQAIKMGSETFLSHYLMARVAFEVQADTMKAVRFCETGLKKFPKSAELRNLKGLLNDITQPAVNIRQQNSSNTGMTRFAQNLIEELNFARTRPNEYAEKMSLIRRYYKGKLFELPGEIPVKTTEGSSAIDEAIYYLRNVKPAPALKYSHGMSRSAQDHVNDQSRNGTTGHGGADGSAPHQRLDRYGKWWGVSGENIAYGQENVRMLVMQLIIDDGVRDRGHRKNIFNPKFRRAGVGVGSHPKYRTMCVITFAGEYAEAATAAEN